MELLTVLVAMFGEALSASSTGLINAAVQSLDAVITINSIRVLCYYYPALRGVKTGEGMTEDMIGRENQARRLILVILGTYLGTTLFFLHLTIVYRMFYVDPFAGRGFLSFRTAYVLLLVASSAGAIATALRTGGDWWKCYAATLRIDLYLFLAIFGFLIVFERALATWY